jgi:putative intracellular protease/amidase
MMGKMKGKEKLKGSKVAILATDGFEHVELMERKKALENAGVTTHVLSPKSGEIKGWKFKEWGDAVKEKTMTSWPSLKTEMKNAGANWVDREVVAGGNFLTSRKPDDLRAFSLKIIEEIADGKHLKAAS